MIGRTVKRVHPVVEGSAVVQFETYTIKDVLNVRGELYISLVGLNDDYFLLLSAFEIQQANGMLIAQGLRNDYI